MDLVTIIKERWGKYQTYYEILGIKNRNVTDEEVEDAYKEMCKKTNAFFKDNKEKDAIEAKEMIMNALDDAYTALKTEDSRKNYQDLLDEIENKKGNER